MFSQLFYQYEYFGQFNSTLIKSIYKAWMGIDMETESYLYYDQEIFNRLLKSLYKYYEDG